MFECLATTMLAFDTMSPRAQVINQADLHCCVCGAESLFWPFAHRGGGREELEGARIQRAMRRQFLGPRWPHEATQQSTSCILEQFVIRLLAFAHRNCAGLLQPAALTAAAVNSLGGAVFATRQK